MFIYYQVEYCFCLFMIVFRTLRIASPFPASTPVYVPPSISVSGGIRMVDSLIAKNRP